MSPTRITLLTKPGCHLCDVAREVVDTVIAELPDAASVAVTERSILDDPALAGTYGEQIPVVLIDDDVHTFWRVDPVRLRAALTHPEELNN